jgi:rhodanese-related sulfurtransferase
MRWKNLKTSTQIVNEAKAQIENLTAGNAVAEAENGALLVDIRESEEIKMYGHIPGAIFAPRGMLEFFADPESAYFMPDFVQDRRIILYCAFGGRSALAVLTLKDMGYSDVAHIEGGMQAWKLAGLPITPPK